MIDWYVLLTPLLLLPIALLLVFVGCQEFFPIDEPPEAPPDEPPPKGPVFVALEISPGCDSSISVLAITVTSDMSEDVFNIELTTIPSQGTTISTLQLDLVDEGTVTCSLTITPLGPPPFQEPGDAFDLEPVTHEKLKDETVAPFKLSCPDVVTGGDFELT